MTFESFKAIRKKLFLSQWELALKLGVSQSSVTVWERGYRPIPDDIKAEMGNLNAKKENNR